jgi:hypothetical protein
VNDSYQEVLRWFLNNDWNISFASHERLYQFTREETISDSYPEIRLVYFVNIQPSGTNQTCISQGTYASVILFDGEVIYRSPDYKDASLEYFYNAPDCPTNADTVP